MSRPLLVRGGRVVDPAAGRDGKLDVLLSEGRVAEVGEGLRTGDAEVLDAYRTWFGIVLDRVPASPTP